MSQETNQKIIVYWDLENNARNDTESAAKSLFARLEHEFPGREIEIKAFCSSEQEEQILKTGEGEEQKVQRLKTGRITKEQKEGCRRAGVDVKEIEEGGANAADYALVTDMMLYARRNINQELILLVGGDDDFTQAMKVLRCLNYQTLQTSISASGKALKKVVNQVEWSDLVDLKRKLDLHSLIKGKPKDAESKKEVDLQPLLKGVKALNMQPLLKGVKALSPPAEANVGVFVDVNSIRVRDLTHRNLVNCAQHYVDKRDMVTYRWYGNFPNHPGRGSEVHAVGGEEYTITSDSKSNKANSLPNHFIAGMHAFAIECAKPPVEDLTPTIVVISSNTELAQSIRSLAEEGLKIILVTPRENQLLRDAIGDKAHSNHIWEENPRLTNKES